MLSLSGLHAFPLILALARLAGNSPTVEPGCAERPTAGPICRAAVEPASPPTDDPSVDLFFHPLGLALMIGFLPPNYYATPPSYPSDPAPSGLPPPGGDPSGGDPSGGDPSGGDPSGGDPSGGKPPPTVNNTPEPATLISGMLGIGLMGLAGWRRKRKG